MKELLLKFNYIFNGFQLFKPEKIKQKEFLYSSKNYLSTLYYVGNSVVKRLENENDSAKMGFYFTYYDFP